MKKVMFVGVLVVGLLALPTWADFFRVTGDGSFDTYNTSDSSAIEGYTNAGAGASARLGYGKQGHGWLAWDAKNSNGVEAVSAGDVSGQTMAQFLAANPTATAKLWVNLNTASLVGTYALETIRCGNTGAIQEDAGSGTGFAYTSPASSIAGSAQPWAWSAGAAPYPVNAIVNGPSGASTPWIAAGTTSSHYAGGSFAAGANIQWGGGTKIGYDGTMASNGGEPWALAALLGMDWSQGGTSVARAATAGQIVNNDGAGNAVLFGAANYVGSAAPRPGAAAGNWYAITLSSDLLASLANDSATKALLFNNWFAGTASSSANPAMVTLNQGSGSGAAFLEVTPEPATMALLALGGLLIARRRRN